jgi:hypothetical protein
MEITQPRLLIVGDSFFSRDKDFPDQHWSEMLPDYDVDNRAMPGSSISMIQHSLIEGLKDNPAAVVIGFTNPGRIEFKNNGANIPGRWVTHLHRHLLTNDQKLLTQLYMSLTDSNLTNFGAFWQILGILHFLKNLNIPFVYSLGSFQLQVPVTPALTNNITVVNAEIAQFDKHNMNLNLSTYPDELQHRVSPAFHILDPNWQSGFASEVMTKLKTLDI